MFSLIKETPADKGTGKAKASRNDEKLLKEIDKIWKFQTKGVAELVSQIGDSDKKHKTMIDEIKKEITDKTARLSKDMSSRTKGENEKSLKELKNKIGELSKRLADRDESNENFSTTISELIVNLEESLTDVKTKAAQIEEGVGSVKESLPDSGEIIKKLESAVEKELGKTIKAVESGTKGGHWDKIDLVLESQKEQANQNTLWRDETSKQISKLLEGHEEWEKRVANLAESQSRLEEMLEADKARRAKDESKTNKKEARTFNNLGVTSFHNGAFEAAKKQFLKAVDLDPQFAEAYNNLGLACTETGCENEATGAFKKATELNPDIPAAYGNLGYLLHKKGKYEEAIEMYHESLGRNANSSSAYTNLGNAYYKLGKHDKARKAWEKALAIDPGNEKASLYLKRIQSEKC